MTTTFNGERRMSGNNKVDLTARSGMAGMQAQGATPSTASPLETMEKRLVCLGEKINEASIQINQVSDRLFGECPEKEAGLTGRGENDHGGQYGSIINLLNKLDHTSEALMEAVNRLTINA